MQTYIGSFGAWIMGDLDIPEADWFLHPETSRAG